MEKQQQATQKLTCSSEERIYDETPLHAKQSFDNLPQKQRQQHPEREREAEAEAEREREGRTPVRYVLMQACLHSVSTLTASSAMRPPTTALVVAMAWMMFPAMPTAANWDCTGMS